MPVKVLETLYRHADWAATRQGEPVAAAVGNTWLLLTGWYDGRCVAMLRVISDGVYRALIDDVIVHPDCQGRGWGRAPMAAALAHPRLRDVEEVALFTFIPAFYEKFGFERVSHGMKLPRLQHR